MKKNQSNRLTKQHKKSKGVVGIFGHSAKLHDCAVNGVTKDVINLLSEEFPQLEFRYRSFISKLEINRKLNAIDKELGVTLFVEKASIRPDGGIVEVKDDNENWRIILVSEAKQQGKDIENIKKGKKVGKLKNQDIMAAGNAIERAHKNIDEIANFMIGESYFPYVLFLEGSNFLTETISVKRPNGKNIVLTHDSGLINRLDRLTAANYGMKLNTNLTKNKTICIENNCFLLQSASIYTSRNGSKWDKSEMINILFDVAMTSLEMISKDLFKQLIRK